MLRLPAMIKPQKAVIKRDGKYLLLLRAAHLATFPEHWDFPGGRLDPGETKEEAVIREVFEETSLAIENPKVVGIYNLEIKKVGFGLVEFTIHTTSNAKGEVKLSDEHTDFKWLTKDEILEITNLHPYIRDYFKENP